MTNNAHFNIGHNVCLQTLIRKLQFESLETVTIHLDRVQTIPGQIVCHKKGSKSDKVNALVWC